MPFLIAVLILGIFAVIYYNSPLSQKKEDSPMPTLTAEPTTITVIPELPEQTTITVDELESILEPASDLITSRYHYTNAADFDSVLTWFGSGIENPFTHSKGYLMYDGVVSVGIDLSEITFDIDNDERIVIVHLPKEKILAHEIDDSSVKSDSKESIFNTLDAEYYAKLIDGLKKNTEAKVLSDKQYMKEVRNNTELVLRNFFAASDLTSDYTFQFD